jgi:hypothetical protein
VSEVSVRYMIDDVPAALRFYTAQEKCLRFPGRECDEGCSGSGVEDLARSRVPCLTWER